MLLLAVIMIGIGIFVCVKTQKLSKSNATYARKEEVLESLIADEQARQQKLEEQQAFVQSKQYVEEVARNRLRLLYPDEYLFVNQEAE